MNNPTASPATDTRPGPYSPRRPLVKTAFVGPSEMVARYEGRLRRRGLTGAAGAIFSKMVKYSGATLDQTFSALGHPTRRAILDRLSVEPGLSVSDLAAPLSMKLPAMMKHLDVLSDAGLITRSKRGRVVSVALAPEPMAEAMRWLEQHEKFWSAGLDRLAAYAESRPPKTEP